MERNFYFMEKKCIRGINCIRGDILQDISKFYKHFQMKDGHVNKCKSCCKKEADEREKKLREDINFVEKEKSRHKEKYHRLGYKDKHKPTYEVKK